MGNNNEDAAPGPTDTTTGSAEGDTTGPSQAETISRLQDELLEAAGSNAAEVTNLISEIRRISPEAAICRTAPRGETPLHKVMDNKEATDDIIAEILKAMTEEEINRADGHGWSALGRAAWDNRVDFARTLLAAGADIACCAHARYGPPLNCAVLFGHIEVARAICEHAGENGVDIDKRNLIGFTPLHTACRNDATEMVDLLLDHGADMNLACEAMLNVSPLDLAVRKGSEGTVRVLIRHGARIQDRTASGWTPLFTAVFRTDDKLVRMLLDLGADVNGTSEDGRTPLTGAAGKRGLSTVKLLLDRGAHFDKPDASGRTPLGVAACNGTDENVQLFLDLGADINKPSRHGRTPLAVACHRGNLRIVYLLLERKADPRILDSDGHSPLFLASIGGFSGIVAALLATGVVNVDATDAQGRTALHMACLSGTGGERSGRFDLPRADYAQTVDLLTRHGANTELRTAAGETMLHFAAESINVDHIRILLKHMRQADILATTPSGKTALDISIGRRTRKVAALLLSTSVCGIPPEAIDEATLRWAAEDESTHKIVQMKLKRDADRESRLAEIKSHWSALDVAAYLGQYVLVQQLLRGLSPSRDRIERIEHAISVLDAANSTPRVMGMTSAMEDSSDRNEKEDTQMNNEELQDPAKLEPFSETVSHRYMAVKALLKVAGSSARTSNMVIELQLPTTVVEVKRRHEASIFDFYSGGTVSTVSRKVAPVHNVIYTQGPQAIMDVQRRFDEKARSMVEAMEWPKDDDSVALRTEALAELVPGHDKDLILRWVHLPANNVRL